MSTTLQNFDGGVEERPDECQCIRAFHDLACFACYRAGFDEPNPDAPEVSDDE
ncbi:hypothetical protein [Natrialba taiwanensis]|uniref:hypothetical protein n=1 Tax=Natrialba taiwanensis TaxID=160846 RepID=UPI00135F1721|nr:hypothetical protein [Natrialba taiwanensis]